MAAWKMNPGKRLRGELRNLPHDNKIKRWSQKLLYVLGVTSSNVNFDTLIIRRRLKAATILSLNLLHPDFPFLHPHPISLTSIFPDGRDHIKWWCRQEEEFSNPKAWPKPPRSAEPLYSGKLRNSNALREN
jgi:hypothetical protein